MKNDLDIEFQVLKKVVYDCSGIDINTTSRKREIVDQKKIFCLVAYNEMSASYSSVGRFMGLGHATIMHHVENAFELLRYDKEFEKKYNRIKDEYLSKEKLISAEKIKQEINIVKKYLKKLKKELKKFDNKNNNY